MQKIKFFSLFLIFVSLLALASADAQTKIATDPSRIGVGARPLGMGKSFVGLADDTSSIFLNPAGLAGISRWQATSMSGKFINEYDYLNLGAAYPTDYGVFGLGYIGGSISFLAPAVTEEVLDGVRIIPSSSEGSAYSFGNSVLMLSWAKQLKGLFDQEAFDYLSAGATFKLFSLNLSGPGVGLSNSDSGSGYELDLGLHYTPTSMFRAGIMLQNALPFSAGGKIVWGDDSEESLLSTLKLGGSLKLLGNGGWQQLGDHQLWLNIDRDMNPTRSDLPQLWHMGLEWAPMHLIDLRVGIDQETIGKGGVGQLDVTNNFTAGVGVYLSGFRFDYAFHQYNNLTANDTHYFSLSYGVRPEEEGDYVTVEAPAWGAIVYPPSIPFTGRVLRRDVAQVIIQDKAALIDEQRRFSVDVNLEYARNWIPIRVIDNDGKVVYEAEWKIVRLMSFKDVVSPYWSKLQIEYLATLGIILGYPDKTFRPDNTITRAELTTLLMRTKGEGDTTETGFSDVLSTHWAAKYIAAAVRTGVVEGYPDGTFKPNQPINRVEGVSVIMRFLGKTEPSELIAPYLDVPTRHWGVKAVAAAKETGYLDYVVGEYFWPKSDFKRAEVAYQLFKTDYVINLIKEKL